MVSAAPHVLDLTDVRALEPVEPNHECPYLIIVHTVHLCDAP